VLHGTHMPNASCLYFQGTTQVGTGSGAVFGDGLRCAGGAVIRLGLEPNTNGASQYPAAGDGAISVVGADIVGFVRTYQCWYRDPQSFCLPATYNLSNGLLATWTP
jgi:hypothetical protein